MSEKNNETLTATGKTRTSEGERKIYAIAAKIATFCDEIDAKK